MLTKLSRYILPTCILCSICFFSACDNGNASSSDKGRITGVSQKGPFIAGSTVNLFGLDSNLHQTGTHLVTAIEDDQGKFSFDEIEVSERFAWMQARGYFLNEITGDTSAMEISLNGLVDLSKGNKANINILSHMAFNRIKYLVGNGMNVENAKEQAEKEVLDAFGLVSDGNSFEELDIMSGSEDDAKLLALSIEMLMDDADSVTKKLAIISNDMETDGVLNDTTLFPDIELKLIEAFNLGLVENVRNTLTSLGAKTIPPYEKYLYKLMPNYPFFDSCSVENEIRSYTNSKENTSAWHYMYRRFDGTFICRDSKWKSYQGLLSDGDNPVDTAGRYGVMIDPRDGNTYKTVTLDLESGDSAVWFVDFSRYGFDQKSSSGFTVEEAYDGGCTSGWHMPRLEELLAAFDGDDKRAIRNRELLFLPFYEDSDSTYGMPSNDEMTSQFFVLNYLDDGTLFAKRPYLAEVFDFSYEVVNDGYGGMVRCVKDSI